MYAEFFFSNSCGNVVQTIIFIDYDIRSAEQ